MAEKQNASAEREGVPEWEASAGWKPKYTIYVTVTRDDLSSYFLYGNDSNGMLMGRKLIRGLGMRGNFVCENEVCARFGQSPQVAREADSRPESVMVLLSGREF